MTIEHKTLFLILTKPDDALDDDKEWWENIGRFVPACPACGSYTTYPRPFTAVVQNRQRGTMAVSGYSCYCLVKRPFYDLLAPHMPGVVPGEVRFGDGRVQKDSLTLNFPTEMSLLLRGGHGSRAKRSYRTCEACGRRLSTIGTLTRPIYVLRHEVPAHREVFNSNIFLAITERLRDELDFSPFPDIRLQPVAVLDVPIERIPELGDPEP